MRTAAGASVRRNQTGAVQQLSDREAQLNALRVVARTSESAVCIIASGDIDFATVDQFEQALTDAFSSPADELQVDLAGATFIDSIGISALVRARKLADESGRRFRIVEASSPVQSVLKLMGLADYMGQRRF